VLAGAAPGCASPGHEDMPAHARTSRSPLASMAVDRARKTAGAGKCPAGTSEGSGVLIRRIEGRGQESARSTLLLHPGGSCCTAIRRRPLRRGHHLHRDGPGERGTDLLIAQRRAAIRFCIRGVVTLLEREQAARHRPERFERQTGFEGGPGASSARRSLRSVEPPAP